MRTAPNLVVEVVLLELLLFTTKALSASLSALAILCEELDDYAVQGSPAALGGSMRDLSSDLTVRKRN